MRAADSNYTRRTILAGLGAAAAMPVVSALAGDQAIAVLIERARDLPTISQRIAAISSGLLGRRYQANTLIGSPRRAEVFVVRDDRFDCVTFCETVLAAARSRDLVAFEDNLRAIRYRNGVIAWRERNHDFAAWCARNVADGICEPLVVGPTVDRKKTLDTPRALGRRSYDISAVTRETLMRETTRLKDGDIIGFVSKRRSLDFYHTGFIMFGGKDEFLLRHASEMHGRVLDQPMREFVAINRVQYVTLLRPRETGESRKA